MSKIQAVRYRVKEAVGYIWKFGGMNAILFRAEDVLRGTHHCERYLQRTFEATRPEEYPEMIKKVWKLRTGKTLDESNLRSFNEKLQWVKMYDISPLMTRLADKYLVREWVADKIGEKYLIPLLGVWDHFDDIDFDALPDKFVLKCNHGSSMNIVVKDKRHFDRQKAKEQIELWLSINYAFAYYGFELQYKDIPRKIIAEQYIEQMDENLLDYKIHCFGGEAKIIQVIGSRDMQRHTAKEAFFDPQWKPANLMYHIYDSFSTLPEKPGNLEEMLHLAEALSRDFRYVRVDLYQIDGQIKFGEMTFTPAAGFGIWTGDEQYLVGSWIQIDDTKPGTES